MQPFFRSLEIAALSLVKVVGTRITYQGLENIPLAGGAVIAINHTSYVDFVPAGLAAYHRGRRMRFMIKSEMQDIKIMNYLIRHTGTIPVDRHAGADAYQHAVAALRAGEVVGVYPEATISRSFELREFKTGAGRMAVEAQVPLIPLIVWGAQRIWTKDHPRNVWRNKVPVLVQVGQPVTPSADVEDSTARLRRAMAELLDRTQQQYPHPAGAYWVPNRLGGSAPTMAEAIRMREAELAERARHEPHSGGGKRHGKRSGSGTGPGEAER